MSKRLASTFFTALALLHVPGYSLWRLTRTHLEIAAVSLLEPPRASRQGLDALTSKHTTNTKRNVPKIYSEKQRPAKGFHKHLLYAGFATYLYIHIYIYSWRTLIAMALVASLLLVAMPGAPNSVLFLVVRPGAPSSVLITSSRALVTFLRQDALAKMQRAFAPKSIYIHLYKDNMAASVLALPSRFWEPAHWLSHSTTMAASVLAHTHFNYDGSHRAGFAIWTMAASVLACPLQL